MPCRWDDCPCPSAQSPWFVLLASDSARHSQEALSLTDVPCGHPVSECMCTHGKHAHTCVQNTHIYKHTQTQKRGTDTFTHTNAHIYKHTQTHKRAQHTPHTHKRTHAQACTHTRKHAHAQPPSRAAELFSDACHSRGCLLELLLNFYNTPSSLPCSLLPIPSLPG